MPQRGVLFIFAGVPLVLAGILTLKFTGNDLVSWVLMAGGAITSAFGGIQVSLSQTPVPYADQTKAP